MLLLYPTLEKENGAHKTIHAKWIQPQTPPGGRGLDGVENKLSMMTWSISRKDKKLKCEMTNDTNKNSQIPSDLAEIWGVDPDLPESCADDLYEILNKTLVPLLNSSVMDRQDNCIQQLYCTQIKFGGRHYRTTCDGIIWISLEFLRGLGLHIACGILKGVYVVASAWISLGGTEIFMEFFRPKRTCPKMRWKKELKESR